MVSTFKVQNIFTYPLHQLRSRLYLRLNHPCLEVEKNPFKLVALRQSIKPPVRLAPRQRSHRPRRHRCLPDRQLHPSSLGHPRVAAVQRRQIGALVEKEFTFGNVLFTMVKEAHHLPG